MLNNDNFYGTSTIGSRGQIVIPVKARKILNIKDNDEFIFFGHGRMIHMIKANELNSFLDKITEKFSQKISGLRDRVKNVRKD